MLKHYNVFRIGKCVECEHNVRKFLGDFEAENSEEAINKATDRWGYDNFGQAGAMQENDVCKEEIFFNAEFVAEEINE